MVSRPSVDLDDIVRLQLEVFPEHADYLQRRFAGIALLEKRYAEKIAQLIGKIAGPDLRTFCEDYRWLVERFQEEELEFRRSGHYRLSRYADALEQVYSKQDLMSRYMNGLLLTALWWRNHTEILRFYSERYLSRLPAGYSHLEVGPGHGLLLHLAASSPDCGTAQAWDVSQASLDNTCSALKRMELARPVQLLRLDLFEAPKAALQSVVCSEVLEHLEDPDSALKILYQLTAPGGSVFINSPVNAPAPDHIYLFRTPEEVVEAVSRAGFEIEETCFSPCTGSSLERARRLSLTISAAVIGRRPANEDNHDGQQS